jgi:putative membrane protein
MQTTLEPTTPAPKRATSSTHKRSVLDYFGLLLRGFAMGSADVVPGVSGGTMAFILGIYEELIMSIRAIGQPQFIQALLKLRIKEALQVINFPFLVAVGTGIALAILTLAKGLEWMLQNQPIMLWSFFFGLVLASVATVSKRVKRWDARTILSLGAGMVGAYLLVGAVPVQTPNTWWFLIMSGALAICAMILPGISGAFILVLLGKYQFVLAAVNQRDIVSIGLVGIGAAVGIVSFSQILGWLFKRYHDLAVALLTGLMIGSLRKIWPWKETVDAIVDAHGKIIPTIERNFLPSLTVNGTFNTEIALAVVLALLGFAAVMVLDRWANGLDSVDSEA